MAANALSISLLHGLSRSGLLHLQASGTSGTCRLLACACHAVLIRAVLLLLLCYRHDDVVLV